MKNSCYKKTLVLGIIVLFIGMSITPSTGITLEKKSSMLTSYDGNTLYVGGNGTGNYTEIQDAVYMANDGDTIIVFSGIYKRVRVNKTLNIKGIDTGEGNPIVDGNKDYACFTLLSDGCIVEGFITRNAGVEWSAEKAGFNVKSNYNIIRNNDIRGETYNGIYLHSHTKGTNITNNTINADIHGIYMESCSKINISRNTITSNPYAIESWGREITYYRNTIKNNARGILLRMNSRNTFIENEISYCGEYGIYMEWSGPNTFERNNIYSNEGCGIRADGPALIKDNNIYLNNIGIKLIGIGSSSITNNNISNNHYGISIAETNHYKIYHNLFIGNTNHAFDKSTNSWDNGYPSGGNYWDDYSGEDNNGDGLGDTPYSIHGGDNQDRYPLMYFHDRSVLNLDTGKGFQMIHQAIDAPDTLDGHTISVDKGTYYENLNIFKELTLIGSGRGSTIIDGNNSDDVVLITVNNVSISNFTIRDSGSSHAGININSANNQFYMNEITDNYVGININSPSNHFSKNIFSNNLIGLSIESGENQLFYNTFKSNHIGIYINSTNNYFSYNDITINHIGVNISPLSFNNSIYYNSFIDNSQNAYDAGSNIWDDGREGNFWSDYNGTDANGDGIGDTPYNISGGDNQDKFPLMEPYFDDEPPFIWFLNPHRGSIYFGNGHITIWFPISIVIGTIDIVVDVTDDRSGVNKVEIYIDDELKTTDTEDPYGWRWDEKTSSRHILKIVAFDNVGNSATDKLPVWKFF